MNKKKTKDVFLNAIMGATPLEKSDKNYKPIPKNENNQKKKNTIILKKNTPPPSAEKKHQEKEIYTRFKIEKLKINKKLKKGTVNIDKRVDFHGLGLKEAKMKFFETIESCFVAKKRCILFITGKRTNPSQNIHLEKKLYYGKIRNEFLNWAHQTTISRKILAVEQAGISYGGDGAFFVYLRKNKN